MNKCVLRHTVYEHDFFNIKICAYFFKNISMLCIIQYVDYILYMIFNLYTMQTQVNILNKINGIVL
jgi:hypothetical protein